MVDVLAILQEALQIEKQGEEFYEQAAVCAGNVLAEKTFRGLAEQERQHLAYFRAYYDRMSETNEWPPMDTVVMAAMPIPQVARSIFDEAIAEVSAGCQVNEDLKGLYDQAMGFERKSIALYQEQAESATDPERKKFFAFLVDQERGHLRILDRTQEFLTDPASWYTEDEQWFATG